MNRKRFIDSSNGKVDFEALAKEDERFRKRLAFSFSFPKEFFSCFLLLLLLLPLPLLPPLRLSLSFFLAFRISCFLRDFSTPQNT